MDTESLNKIMELQYKITKDSSHHTFAVSLPDIREVSIKTAVIQFAMKYNLILDMNYGSIDTAEFTIPNNTIIIKKLNKLLGTLDKDIYEVAVKEFLNTSK